jgi:hypothetical protein
VKSKMQWRNALMYTRVWYSASLARKSACSWDVSAGLIDSHRSPPPSLRLGHRACACSIDEVAAKSIASANNIQTPAVDHSAAKATTVFGDELTPAEGNAVGFEVGCTEGVLLGAFDGVPVGCVDGADMG